MGFPPYPPTQCTLYMEIPSTFTLTHSHTHTHTYKYTACTHTHTNEQTAEPPRSGLSELFSLRWWVCVKILYLCVYLDVCMFHESVYLCAFESVGIWNGAFLLSSSSLPVISLSISSLLSCSKSSSEGGGHCREKARCGLWWRQKQRLSFFYWHDHEQCIIY